MLMLDRSHRGTGKKNGWNRQGRLDCRVALSDPRPRTVSIHHGLHIITVRSHNTTVHVRTSHPTHRCQPYTSIHVTHRHATFHL